MYFPFGLSQSVNEHESFVWDSQKSLRSSPLPACAQGFLQMKLCVQFLMVSLLMEYLWHAGDLPLVEQKDGSCHQRHYTRNFCGCCRAFFFFFLITSILTDLPSLPVVRCENPVVENGKKLTGFVEQYTYGDTVTFECLPGYFMNGSYTAKCDADSNWNPPLPKCEKREYKQT